jgi:hypothetical protein
MFSRLHIVYYSNRRPEVFQVVQPLMAILLAEKNALLA